MEKSVWRTQQKVTSNSQRTIQTTGGTETQILAPLSPLSRFQPRLKVAFAVVPVVLFLGLLLEINGQQWGRALSLLVLPIAPAISTLVCAAVGRAAPDQQERQGWYLLLTAAGCVLFSSLLTSYSVLGAKSAIAAQTLWFAAYPLGIWGLVQHVPSKYAFNRSMVLDALLLTTIAFGGFWSLLFIGAVENNAVPLSAIVGTLGDLLGICLVALLMSRRLAERIPLYWIYLFAACSPVLIADIVSLVAPPAILGGLKVVLAVSAFSLLGISALARLSEWSNNRRNYVPISRFIALTLPRKTIITLQHGALTIAGIVFLYQFLGDIQHDNPLDVITVVYAMSTVIIVMAKQGLRYSEWQFATELSALYRAAARIGYSLDIDNLADDALTTSLQIAEMKAGVLWRTTEDGQLHIVGTKGMSEAEVAELVSHPLIEAALIRVAETECAQFVSADDISQGSEDSRRCPPVWIAPLHSRQQLVGMMCLVGGNAEKTVLLRQESLLVLVSELGVALDNALRYEASKSLADHDAPTGFLNHRAFYSRLDEERNRTLRNGSCFSVIMMDMDGFKLINDTHGHLVGDRVIKHVAETLRSSMRSSDVLARYGGDEFAAILPDTDSAQALIVAEKACRAVAERTFKEGKLALNVQMSFGIATFPSDSTVVNRVVAIADEQLYAAKRARKCDAERMLVAADTDVAA